MAKRHDSRRIKIHRSYTIAEAAALLGAHGHTVRRWIAAGLQTTDDRRPFLIHGADLLGFFNAREPKKQTCRPGEFFCFGCKAPKRPAADMADYIPKTTSRGLLVGICPTCDKLMHRAASLNTIEEKPGGLDITFQQAERRLDDYAQPISNVDLKRDKQR